MNEEKKSFYVDGKCTAGCLEEVTACKFRDFAMDGTCLYYLNYQDFCINPEAKKGEKL